MQTGEAGCSTDAVQPQWMSDRQDLWEFLKTQVNYGVHQKTTLDTAWYLHCKWQLRRVRLCWLNCNNGTGRLSTIKTLYSAVNTVIHELQLIYPTSCAMLIVLSTSCLVTNMFQSSTEEVFHARCVAPFNASFGIILWPNVSCKMVHSSSILIKHAWFIAAVCGPHMIHITS